MRLGYFTFVFLTTARAVLLAAVLATAAPGARAEPATVIDWANGDMQATEASCGGFTFTHMQDHKSYTLLVRGKTAGTCAFKADGLTFSYPPNFGATPPGTRALFSFARFGSDVMVAWISGY